MTRQHQPQNCNEAQRWDTLPEPVCQQPDKSISKVCAMQQLPGHQSKLVAATNKLNARVLTETRVPWRRDARLMQPHLIEA
jgi:hypothetical protein